MIPMGIPVRGECMHRVFLGRCSASHREASGRGADGKGAVETPTNEHPAALRHVQAIGDDAYFRHIPSVSTRLSSCIRLAGPAPAAPPPVLRGDGQNVFSTTP